MKKIFKYKFYLIALSLILILVSTVFYSRIKDKTEIMKVSEYLISSFIAELPEINKNLPHKVDANTELLSIKFEGNTVFSRYRITKEYSEKIIKLKNQSDLILEIKTNECNEKLKIALIDAGIDLINTYEDPNGNSLFNVALNSIECTSNQGK